MNLTKNRTLLPLAVLSLILLFGVIGCSKSGTVTGKVTYDGKPVIVGTIQFIPESGGKGAKAVIAEIAKGEYKAEKVPPGPCTITVSTSQQRDLWKTLKNPSGVGGGLNPSAGGQGAPNVTKDKKAIKPELPGEADATKQREEAWENIKDMIDVPPQYADPEKAKKTPSLNVTVQAGKQEIDIDLPKVEGWKPPTYK